MMKPRLVSVGVALAAALLSASCRPNGNPSDSPSVPSSTFRVRALDAGAATEEDIARLLDLHFWRFEVTTAGGGEFVDCLLEIHERGKPPRPYGGLSFGPKGPFRGTLVVGLSPMEGSLKESKRLRYLVLMRSGSAGGSSTSNPMDNPLAGCSTVAYPGARQQDDGSFLLLTGSKSGKTASTTPGENDVELVCRIRAMKHRPVPPPAQP